jgi:hypothetical protein
VTVANNVNNHLFRVHPVNQTVGFKENLSILRDAKRAQLVYVSTAVRRRSERFCRPNEPIEDMVSASSGMVLGDKQYPIACRLYGMFTRSRKAVLCMQSVAML